MKLTLLFVGVVWLYFPAGLVYALMTGSIPAKGAKGGGMGWGHIAERHDEPVAFWVTVAVHLFITFGAPIIVARKGMN